MLCARLNKINNNNYTVNPCKLGLNIAPPKWHLLPFDNYRLELVARLWWSKILCTIFCLVPLRPAETFRVGLRFIADRSSRCPFAFNWLQNSSHLQKTKR